MEIKLLLVICIVATGTLANHGSAPKKNYDKSPDADIHTVSDTIIGKAVTNSTNSKKNYIGHKSRHGRHHIKELPDNPTKKNKQLGSGIKSKSAEPEPETVTDDIPGVVKQPDIGEEIDNKTVDPICPECIRKDQEKLLRIEDVKRTILRRLGLSDAPKIDGPIYPLPFDFSLGDSTVNDQGPDGEQLDTHSVRTKEIFIYGKDITPKKFLRKGTGFYTFNISDQIIDPMAVASVELWVYKQTDLNDHYIQTFMVSELVKHGKGNKAKLRPRNVIKRLETRLKYGWMKIYVKRAVMRWLSKPRRNNGLAITCKTCKRRNYKTIFGDKEGLLPIMVFYMKKETPHKKRVKRDTSCIEGGNNCCHKESLEIKFSSIGWGYIMEPTSIYPNYCVGSCNGIEAAHYNHAKMMQTLKHTVAYTHVTRQPCCSPVSFGQPQSLIYRDNENVVRKIDIPDLIVGECGCA